MQGLACHPVIHPSLKISHETLKLVLEKLRKKEMKITKGNELRFQELAAIHPTKCKYVGNQKTKLPLLDN
jgi:hypothetical protein